MHTVWNLVSPDCATTHQVGAVAFAEQNVPNRQPVLWHIGVRHVDRLDLAQIEVATLDISDAKIWPGMFARPVAGALLESVRDSRDIAKLYDFKLGFGRGVTQQRRLENPLVTPALDVAEAGDLEGSFRQVWRRSEAQRRLELALGVAFNLMRLRIEFGGLVQGLLIGGNQATLDTQRRKRNFQILKV